MRKFIFALALCGISACASEQSIGPSAEVEPAHPIRIPGSIEHSLTQPHVLLAHSGALQLTSAQSSEILELTNTARAQLTRTNAELDRRTEALRLSLNATPIDEEAALQAAREVSAVEDEIKLAHLRMLIRVQNTLTTDQREIARSYAVP